MRSARRQFRDDDIKGGAIVGEDYRFFPAPAPPEALLPPSHHSIVQNDGNSLIYQRNFFQDTTNRLPDPSEIRALEFKHQLRRSMVCSSPAAIGLNRSICLQRRQPRHTGSSQKKTVTRLLHQNPPRFCIGLRNRCNGTLGTAPSTTYRASVARYGQPREKRRVRGKPAGYEVGEEPHAFRLARLALREKPERSVHVEARAGRSH
jgi:hypothetical protein